MEIRINVDDDYMEKLKENMRQPKATEIAKDALSLLNWAALEIKRGRVILSSQTDGSDIHRIAMPAFDRMK